MVTDGYLMHDSPNSDVFHAGPTENIGARVKYLFSIENFKRSGKLSGLVMLDK